MLIKEFGEEPFCGSVQTFEYNYYYNDKGLLVKETIRTQTANDIEVVSYKILEVDKWGGVSGQNEKLIIVVPTFLDKQGKYK